MTTSAEVGVLGKMVDGEQIFTESFMPIGFEPMLRLRCNPEAVGVFLDSFLVKEASGVGIFYC